MLDTEWAQLLSQLDKIRGAQTRFFSFVDTVSARNYAGTNDPMAGSVSDFSYSLPRHRMRRDTSAMWIPFMLGSMRKFWQQPFRSFARN